MLTGEQKNFLKRLRSIQFGVPVDRIEEEDGHIIVRFELPTENFFDAHEVLTAEDALAEVTNKENLDLYKRRRVETLIAYCENRGISVSNNLRKDLMNYVKGQGIASIDPFLDDAEERVEREYSRIVKAYDKRNLQPPSVLAHLDLIKYSRSTAGVLVERDDEHCPECGCVDIYRDFVTREKACKECGRVLSGRAEFYTI